VSNFLLPIASHFAGEWVACRFKAFADGAPLATRDDSQPIYEIPDGTSEVTVTATPTAPAYWDATVTLSVSSSGVVAAKAGSSALVRLRTAVANTSRGTVVNIKVSRFKDVTPDVLNLLTNPPTKRAGSNVDEPGDHLALYGAWPPSNWLLPAVPTAHFLDLAKLENTGALTFAKAPAPAIDVAASVVLRLKGVNSPQLFAVVWPIGLAREVGAKPTPIFLFVRQGSGQNVDAGYFKGGTLGPYPDNFDYADIGLFQNLHYGNADAPISTWGPKGVPYQVAKAGANVVTVIPCNSVGPEFGVLNDTEETGKILEEIQAFMFWRAGVADLPKSIGKTAIAAFSSGNFFLNNWLANEKNRSGNFLKNTVNAVYFLDPPTSEIKGFIETALTWAGSSSEKRIRLYSRENTPAHRALLGSAPPPPPYIKNALNNKRTAAEIPLSAWETIFKNVFNQKFDFDWQYAHHSVAATMLTHALAQGDF
jgi:hypothetical protein